jgi:hypothetical protein
MDGAVVHDVVGGVDRESVPLRPPSTQRVTHVTVGGVLQEEVCMVVRGDGQSGSDSVRSKSTRTRYQRGRAVPAGM